MDEITVINDKGRTMQIIRRAWDLLGADKGGWQELDKLAVGTAIPLEIIEFQKKAEQELEKPKVDIKNDTPPAKKAGRPTKTTKK